MKIDLDNKEVSKILKEKYGDAVYRVFYTQSDKEWEEENNKKIAELKDAPKKRSYILYF